MLHHTATKPLESHLSDLENESARTHLSHETLVDQPSPESCSPTTLNSDSHEGNGSDGQLWKMGAGSVHAKPGC